jgi:hypothetical protein
LGHEATLGKPSTQKVRVVVLYLIEVSGKDRVEFVDIKGQINADVKF